MKFNFKIQQYQTDAVDSVVNCFKGQPYIDNVSYRRDIGNKREMQTYSQMSFVNNYEQETLDFTDDFDGFVAIPCGEDTLPIFITSVLIYSSFERISSMDIPELINPIIDDALHRGESYKQCIYKKK